MANEHAEVLVGELLPWVGAAVKFAVGAVGATGLSTTAVGVTAPPLSRMPPPLPPPYVITLDRLLVRFGTTWVSARWSGAPLPSPLFLSFSGMPLHVSTMDFRRLLLTPRHLAREVAANVVADVIVSAPAVIGSLELLGNPTALVQELADGLAAVVLAPWRAAHSPSSAYNERGGGAINALLLPMRVAAGMVGGVTAGVVALSGKAAYGVLSSVGAFSSSLGRNLKQINAAAAAAASASATMAPVTTGAGSSSSSAAIVSEGGGDFSSSLSSLLGGGGGGSSAITEASLSFDSDDTDEPLSVGTVPPVGAASRGGDGAGGDGGGSSSASPSQHLRRALRAVVTPVAGALLLLGSATTQLATIIQDDVEEMQMGGAGVGDLALYRTA